MNPTVLLVDDEPEVIEGLKRSLRKLPYDFLWAYSGAEAVRVLSERAVDVLVSDEMMPEMSGSELLSYARKHHPSVIRIMLTGRASVMSAMNAIYDGWVYQYLHKPCNPADLASAIYNGLLLQSLQTKEEGPHVVMTSSDQDELLAHVAEHKE